MKVAKKKVDKPKVKGDKLKVKSGVTFSQLVSATLVASGSSSSKVKQ